MPERSFGQALVAGGGAGLAVDLSLFPLDTVKTRIQSQQGFLKAGGFRGIYSGLPSVIVGSVPGAALFFVTYESVKKVLHPMCSKHASLQPSMHSIAACSGEVVSCLVRVPTEVIKQRAQAAPHLTTGHVFRTTFKQDGFFGFYRGYWSTVLREMPFSFIQMPLWEFIKSKWSRYQGYPTHPWQSSVAGALSGGFAASITTPLDVAKTRIMLAEKSSKEASGNILTVLKIVHKERGISGLFAGVTVRVMWISIGGAIFLGVYDFLSEKYGKLFFTKEKNISD